MTRAATRRQHFEKVKQARQLLKRKHGVNGLAVYHEQLCSEAYQMFMGGATDREVAEHFGIDVSTMWRWRIEHPEFKEACELGKENIDGRVERSMLERAVGYEYESEKVFNFQGNVIRAPTRVHIPADPGAALNWLKNRKRDTWRDTQDIELSGGLDITDKLGTREMALAMLQTMREAMEDANVPTIEHGELPEKVPMIPTVRPRRRFE